MQDDPGTQKRDPFQKLGYHFIRHPWRFVAIFILIVALIFFLRPYMPWLKNKKQESKVVSVSVDSVKAKDVPVYFSALGTVNAVATITVKTQINGILQKVYFKDGEMVKEGEVLAEIDPRPYEAQVLQFQGQLARDKALLANAKIDLKRYINLYRTNAVSQQTLETQRSLVKQDEGTIKIDQGQINAAQTNLDYCKIIAPVSGQIGLSIVDQGNLVQTSDTTGIAVITTLEPTEVFFPLPQDDLPKITRRFNAGEKLMVTAYDRDQKKLLSTGYLAAIDSQIDTTTGTIKFEGVFDNKDHALFPNQFVNINLQVETLHDALVIPTAAIQQGASGPYVYRYNANHTVTNVPVTTGAPYGEETVIKKGLKANQLVVTEGTDKLFDGAIVVTGKAS